MGVDTISITEKEIKQFVESIRPPVHLRNEIDIGYSFSNNVLEIFETRPRGNDNKVFENYPVAKTRYIKRQRIWKIYWKRATDKWELYEPKAQVTTIQQFFKTIKEDSYGCFWG